MNRNKLLLAVGAILLVLVAAAGSLWYLKGQPNLTNDLKNAAGQSPVPAKMAVTTILLPTEKKIPDSQLTVLSGLVEKLPACVANLLCFKVANTYATELTPERIGRGKVDYTDSYLSQYVGKNVTIKVQAIPPKGTIPAYVRVYGLTVN